MKNWLKKQKYKIAIALCSILSLFTLFLGISKTYAYNTDTFSYTINTNNLTFTTIDNKTGVLLNTEQVFNLNNSTNSNQYLLLNFYAIDTNTNHIQNTYSNLQVSYIAFRDYTNNRVYGYTQQQRITTTASDYMFTFVYKPYNFSEDINSFLLDFYNVSYNYRFLIVNIDYVNYTDIGISQYYDTYYGQIEDNYNTLLNNYNDLQEDYDSLETNYNTLESNYTNLTTEYNNLTNNINSFANSGVLQYIQTIDFELTSYDRQNYWEKEFTLLEFMQTNYFTNTNFIDINLLFSDWIQEVNTSDSALLYVTINFIPIDIDFFNLVTNDIANISFRTISLNNNLTITLNNVNRVTKSSIESSYGNTLDNTQVINIYVEYNTLNSDINTDNSIFTDLSISQVSYNRGFQMGKHQYESLILELNNKITSNEQTIQQLQSELQFSTTTNTNLVSQIDNLETENTRFRYVISSLEAQLRSYQEGSNDYNLNRMIWTIASTPFESFKQIWNVNFFGVNISTMITGFITGIIVLWIIKKFFL